MLSTMRLAKGLLLLLASISMFGCGDDPEALQERTVDDAAIDFDRTNSTTDASDIGTNTANESEKVFTDPSSPQQRLVGTWIRPIRGLESESNSPPVEGLRFDADGTFDVLGMHTMNGLRWNLDDTHLELTTNTDRYAMPSPTQVTLVRLVGQELELGGNGGYLNGVYVQNNTVSSRFVGEVTYRERVALPESAVFNITLVDLDDNRSMVASQVLPALGRQVPIPFHIGFLLSDADPEHRLGLVVTVSVDEALRFSTRGPTEVKIGQADRVTVPVFSIGS